MYSVIFGYNIASGTSTFDGKLREVIIFGEFFEFGPRTIIDSDSLCFTIGICGKPHHARSLFALSQVVLLVAGNACDGKSLRIISASLAITVDGIVYGPLVLAVKYRSMYYILAYKCLIANFGYQIGAVFEEDYDLRNVRAVTDILGILHLFLVNSDKAFSFIGVEFCVGDNHFFSLDCLKGDEFGAARIILSVFLLELSEVHYSVLGQMFQVVLDLLDIIFDS